MNFVLKKDVKENLKNYAIDNNNVPLLHYENFYKESNTYILDVMDDYKMIISIKIDSIARILIGSILGFKEYIYPTELITNRFLFVKVSLQNYFKDTLNINTKKCNKSFNSFFSIFNSKIFLNNSLKDNCDAITIDSNYSYNQFSDEIESIKNILKQDVELLTYDSLCKRKLYPIKYCDLISSLDHIDSCYEINVNLNGQDIDFSLFGEKVENKSFIEQKAILKLKNEKTDIKCKSNDNNKLLYSVLEFFDSQINYFCGLEQFHNEIYIPLCGDKGPERQVLINEIFGPFKKIYEMEKCLFWEIFYFCCSSVSLYEKIDEIVQRKEKCENLKDYIDKKRPRSKSVPEIFPIDGTKKILSTRHTDNLHDLSLEEILFNIFSLFLETKFEVYEEFIIKSDKITHLINEKKEIPDKVKEYIKEDGFRKIIHSPIKKIVDYTSLFRNILSYCRGEQVLKIGKECISSLVKSTYKLNMKQSEFESISMCFKIYDSIDNCPSSILTPDLRYVAYLDTSKDTLFLFNKTLLFCRRRCSSTNLKKLKNGNYGYCGLINIEAVKIAKKMKTDIIIYRIDSVDFLAMGYIGNNLKNANIYTLKKNSKTNEFIQQIINERNFQRIHTHNIDIYKKENSNLYFFFISEKYRFGQCILEFVDRSPPSIRYSSVKNSTFKVLKTGSGYRVFFSDIEEELTTEQFENFFLRYLKNAFDLANALPPATDGVLLFLNKNLKELVGDIKKYENLSHIGKTDIREICFMVNELLLNKKDYLVSEKDYKKMLGNGKFSKNEKSISKMICTKHLYVTDIKNEENELISLTRKVAICFIDTILTDVSYEELMKWRENIDDIETISDLISNLKDYKNLKTILNHFIGVQTRYPMIDFYCVFGKVFQNVDPDKIIKFWNRIST